LPSATIEPGNETFPGPGVDSAISIRADQLGDTDGPEDRQDWVTTGFSLLKLGAQANAVIMVQMVRLAAARSLIKSSSCDEREGSGVCRTSDAPDDGHA
jgi:hypothetical protein